MMKWYLVKFKNWHSQFSFTDCRKIYEAENPKHAVRQATAECKHQFELIDIKLIES